MRGVYTNGENISSLRKLKGLTQEQLAASTQLDVTTIRKMEKGERKFDLRTVVVVAESLGVEIERLIAINLVQPDHRAKHLNAVHQWHQGMVDADVDRLISLHTEDTELYIAASEGLPAAGNFKGVPALREHFTQFFQLFRIRVVQEDNFDIHAADNLVFLRTTASIEFLPKGECYTTRHLNEFEFRDGLIARRIVIADYGQLRQLLE